MTKREYKNLLKESAINGTFPSHTNMSIGSAPACRYRKDLTPDCTQKCAVGILIPNEKYTPEFENQALQTVLTNCDIKIDGLSTADFRDIQIIHDDNAYEGEWNSEKFISKIESLPCLQESLDE